MQAVGEVSVVIAARDAAGSLPAQLDALAAQEWDGRWEVVVADNGSTDGTREIVERWTGTAPSLRLVDASGRRGPAHARNVGAAAAKGELLLFVDADDVVQPGWLAAMADAGAHADLIAGANVAFGTHAGEASSGLGRTTAWSSVIPSAGFLDAAPSNNLGVSRALWEAIQGFREDMVASEDTAFCWDAQLRGHAIRRVPSAMVMYSMRETLGGLWRQQYRWGMAAAQLYALFKDAGAPRSSVAGALARWIGIVVLSPSVMFSEQHRRDWVGRTSRRCGRLVGSLRFRVVHL